MTVTEAARILEVRPGFVYKLCSQGRLAHYRIGGGKGGRTLIRLEEQDVLAFKASCRVEAAQAPPRAAPQPDGARTGGDTVPLIPGGYFERRAARRTGRRAARA